MEATPTPLLLDEALIAKIRGVQIRAKHLVNDVFAGEYQSAFKGRGLEFEEVRDYQPGDDIRTIDWNVTARTGHPYIKLYKDERELTVMFVVDVSASSRFGTVEKFKNEISAEITALLAYTALKNNDKVGMIIFSDRVEHFIPPKKGRAHIWRLIRDMLAYESKAKKTNFDIPLDFLNRVIKKRSIAFLISDFQAGTEVEIKEFESNLRISARHHDLIALSIKDPREISLPKIGFIELEDAETGESILVDTFKSSTLEEYTMLNKSESKKQRIFFRKSGIDFVELQTDQSYLDAIVRFFRKREKRRA